MKRLTRMMERTGVLKSYLVWVLINMHVKNSRIGNQSSGERKGDKVNLLN